MTFDLNRLVRPDIAAMESYTPIVPFDVLSHRLGRPPEAIIKLDANENPYGPSPRVHHALANERYYHIYPDPDSHALREALGNYLNVDKGRIMVGHGADELIDLLMRLFLQPGDVVIDCPPTFGMYSFDAGINGGRVVPVPRLPDFSVDIAAVEGAVANAPRAKLMFVTSPNNPDGGTLCDADLRRLLKLPLIVILDEAYVEFHGKSRVRWVAENANLIVLRTFSKWAGLAGLRVGYGVFPEEIMPHLWKIKQPYNVNVAGTTAALASLSDLTYLMENVEKLIAERERLYQELSRFEFLRPYPSQANFILCRVLGHDALQLKLELERHGILVRYFSKPGLTDHLRISVGRPEQTDRLLIALRHLAGGQ
ncbi:histidinol-phosphate transaminase [Candidatus Poribacteria bacterium]|nr:histidinol-phosphate transaminase [Candidatus Poribacteria bacterium]